MGGNILSEHLASGIIRLQNFHNGERWWEIHASIWGMGLLEINQNKLDWESGKWAGNRKLENVMGEKVLLR